jgi:hypothetical protein
MEQEVTEDAENFGAQGGAFIRGPDRSPLDDCAQPLATHGGSPAFTSAWSASSRWFVNCYSLWLSDECLAGTLEIRGQGKVPGGVLGHVFAVEQAAQAEIVAYLTIWAEVNPVE